MGNDKLLSTQEVLARLSISRPTLYALIERGQIKPVEKPSYLKRASKLQFKERDVEKLLNGDPDAESPPQDCVAVA